MTLRKEQILAIAALLLAVWLVKGLEPPRGIPTPRPQPQSYEAGAIPVSPLVPIAADPKVPTSNLFSEPSETRPLPPRTLQLPTARVFGVVGLPLSPGPDASWQHLLELAGGPVEGVELSEPQPGSGATAPLDDGNVGGEPEQDPGRATTGRPSDAELARTYDHLVTKDRGTFWGFIEPADGMDKYDLALMSEAELAQVTTVTLRRYNRTNDRLMDKARSERLEDLVAVNLADTLRNEVELAKRRVADKYNAGGLMDLYSYGEELVELARQESWVYDEALELADRILEISSGSLRAYTFKRRLLRLRGDLAGEWSLYESMPKGPEYDAFRLRSRGELKAVLGLWEDAEVDLRASVEIQPQEPATLATLAELLLDLGRVADGARYAQTAWDYRNGNPDPEVQLAAAAVHLQALFAQGKVEQAQAVARELPSGDPAQVGYLRGCVEYVGGTPRAATDQFASAAASSQVGLNSAGALGIAAVAVRDGQWQQALDGFTAVADSDPLLRHRALTGVALVYARVGQLDSAIEALDAAREAAPNDGYAHYLRGHVLRLRGNYTAALEALERCLELHDDMLHALLEVVLCREALAEQAPAQEAENLVRALRYADRLVALAEERGGDFRFAEVQGRVHYRAKQLRTADQAFARAQEGAQTPADQHYAQAGRGLVLYSQGRVEDALDAFLALQDGLRREDAFWQYADEIITAIDEHSQKVQLVDRFERDSLGNIWDDRGSRGDLRIVDGEAVLRARLGPSPTVVPRTGAAPVAGRFLGVEVSLRMMSSSPGAVVGLNLRKEQGGRVGLDVWYGMREGRPYLMIEEQSMDAPQPVEGLADAVGDFDPKTHQRLALYVEPKADGRTLQLVATWNDVILHRHDLRGFTTSTTGELLIQLGGKGRGGEAVAGFDDLRILRREVR